MKKALEDMGNATCKAEMNKATDDFGHAAILLVDPPLIGGRPIDTMYGEWLEIEAAENKKKRRSRKKL